METDWQNSTEPDIWSKKLSFELYILISWSPKYHVIFTLSKLALTLWGLVGHWWPDFLNPYIYRWKYLQIFKQTLIVNVPKEFFYFLKKIQNDVIKLTNDVIKNILNFDIFTRYQTSSNIKKNLYFITIRKGILSAVFWAYYLCLTWNI